MNAKTKNPLYVVKGKDVQAASSLFDMLVKKFDLEPMLRLLQQLLQTLLEQVQSYHVLALVKGVLDQLLAQLQPIVGRFTRA